MTEDEIIRAIGLGENEDWEFKNGRGGVGPSVLESVSAFSNTSGGVIVCGVLSKDNEKAHDLIGVKDPQKYKQNLWNALNNRQQISPVQIESKDVWITSVGTADLVCIRVPEADRTHRPVFTGTNPFGGTRKRRDSGDYVCSDDEVRRMLRDATSAPQDGMVFEGTSLADIDLVAFSAYRNVFASKKPTHPLLKLDDTALLTKLGGMKDGKKGGLTLAGVVMFGRAETIRDALPDLFLDYYEQVDDPSRRYDDRVSSYDGDWEPNLFNFFYKVYPKLVEGLRTPFALDSDAMRKAQTPFHDALREALINTLVHTDYLSRGSILIGKLRDAFTFQNPGRSLTPIQRILAARRAGEKLSDVRNPNLVGMFFMPGLAERQGACITHIRCIASVPPGKRP